MALEYLTVWSFPLTTFAEARSRPFPDPWDPMLDILFLVKGKNTEFSLIRIEKILTFVNLAGAIAGIH